MRDRLHCLFTLLLLATILPAQGAIAFGSQATATLATEGSIVGFADFDDDGDDDAVVEGVGPTGSLLVCRNDGSLGFVVWQILGTSPIGCSKGVRGDFNGDGKDDLASASFCFGPIEVIRLESTGLFSRTFITAPTLASPPVSVVDFDQDGDEDIFVSTSSVLINDGSGAFPTSVVLALPGGTLATTVRAADLDADGDIDFVSEMTFISPVLPAGGFDIIINQGVGGFVVRATLVGGLFADLSLELMDIDGNGLTDFALIELTTDSLLNPVWQIRTFIQAIAGHFSPAEMLLTQPLASPFPTNLLTAAGDLDADGRDDLVVFQKGILTAGRADILRGRSGRSLEMLPSVSVPVSTGVPTGRCYVADLDGDGDLDLAQDRLIGPNGTGPLELAWFANQSQPATPRPHIVLRESPPFVKSYGSGPAAGRHAYGVFDASSGLPVSGSSVTATLRGSTGFEATWSGMTDAQGRVQVHIGTNMPVGSGSLRFEGTTFDSRIDFFNVYQASVALNLAPPSGLPFAAATFETSPVLPMPLVLTIDLPPLAPLQTPFGDAYTSIFSPGPNFGALDGLGLFGSPNPNLIAAPLFVSFFPISSLPPAGLTVVCQFFGLDFTLPWPWSIVIGPPHLLTF